MRYIKNYFIIIILLIAVKQKIYAQQTSTNQDVLNRMVQVEGNKNNYNLANAYRLARKNNWPLILENKVHNKILGTSILKGLDHDGFPIYLSTFGNNSASTISTDKTWQTYGINGSSANMKDKLAIWDGGTVRKTHIELVGRILQKDSAYSIHSADDHATHTTGTLIATGLNPSVKGMANGTGQLIVYDFINDFQEVASEASNLLLSSHSYGTNAGWVKNGATWYFYGNPDSLADYKFGFYGEEAQTWDSILYHAPNYLIVQAAGNYRTQNGPAISGSFQYFSPIDSVTVLTGTRSPGMSSNDSYQTIPTYGNAKNILTIGAVNPIINGYTSPSDVVMTSFSSWGPTDDGRIKPDLVADGINVLSTVATGDNAYAIDNGTSMATPSVTGSLYLLQELYSQKHSGAFMKSASLKALAIHTADEAGTSPGPDYQFGWGLMNTKRAADFIADISKSDTVIEATLNNADTFRYSFTASGADNVKATLAWTDAPASINWAYRLNNPATKLINDLDIVVLHNGITYSPWVLTPTQPSLPAFKGINNLDNVERIDIDTTYQGTVYTVVITHKGILQRGSQSFSLVLSGINGSIACASNPTDNTGLKIDSLSLNNLQLKNTVGCTTYTDNRSYSANIESHQNINLNLKLGNCSNIANANAVVKAYIDYNHNGLFTDPGELVATSNVLNGLAIFDTSFTTPYGLEQGAKLTMRIVANETTDTSTVHACGTYLRGETMDITLLVNSPTNDIETVSIITPSDSACSSNTLVGVQLHNKGTATLTNIPLTLTIKIGSNVYTQNDTCKATINANDLCVYTFPKPVSLNPSSSYAITIKTNLATDQDTTNNTVSKTIQTATLVSTPSGTGEICSGYAYLEVNNPNTTANYYWFDSPINNTPIGNGSYSITNEIPSNNTFYLGTGLNTNLGLNNKNLFSGGGGYSGFNGSSPQYFNYVASNNMILQSARIYTGYPGKITISCADVSGNTVSVLSSVTLDAPATLPNPVSGNYSVNDVSDTGAIYELNLPLSQGTHYIVISTENNATLFGNNNVTGSPYPIGNTNVIALLNNSATTYQTNYFGLYNMNIVSTDCPSVKTPVVATAAPIPVITQSHDTLYSSIQSNNQWFENGNPLFMETNYYTVVADSAIYTVSTTDNFGCMQTSDGYLFDSSSLKKDNLMIYPNPVTGHLLNVNFKLSGQSDVKFTICNLLGQVCYYKDYSNMSGIFNDKLNIGNLVSGIYFLTIQTKSSTIRKELICMPE